MHVPIALHVSLVCALALLSTLPAPAARASSRIDVRAGYDSDPDGGSDQPRGDTWAAVTAGTTLTRDTGGPLTLSLDVALGATAFARLTELDRIALVVTPALDYVISPRVAASLALVTEGQFVEDDDRSAWGWGGYLRLREQLSTRVSLAEYLSYRDLTARDAEYSGTKVAIGLFLRTYLGERWTLGAGGEYAHGDFLSGDAQGFGGTGMGTGSQNSRNFSQDLVREDEQPLVQQDEDRLSGSLALSYAWSGGWSSGVEYVYTRVMGNDGGDQHAAIVSATYGF